MSLVIFIDALPFTEISNNYRNWFPNIQISELQPNIGYSSTLHWQLFCNKYPDELGSFVDWVKEPENNQGIKIISKILSPLDRFGDIGSLSRKILNRIIYRNNRFANIPFKFRSDFSEKGNYLFWNADNYSQEQLFKKYTVISQDEEHLSFEETVDKFSNAIENKDKDIFVVLGFADMIGHKCRRGELYSSRLKPYMNDLKMKIGSYLIKYPKEKVLILSDHGMSTVNRQVKLRLEEYFGKQSKNTYVAYCDTAVMCIWVNKEKIRYELEEYLSKMIEGHLLSDVERKQYGVANHLFGDLIFILKEGNVFSDNWFGKSFRKPNPDGTGMHGFWPEREARDQMACMILINGNNELKEFYNYNDAYNFISTF